MQWSAAMPFLRVSASQVLNPRSVGFIPHLSFVLRPNTMCFCEFNRTLQRLPDKSHVMVVGAVLECNVEYSNFPSDSFWQLIFVLLSPGPQGASSNRRRLWAVDQTRKSKIVQLQLRGNIRDDSGWATFALLGNKKLTSACSLTSALWRCVTAIWIFEFYMPNSIANFFFRRPLSILETASIWMYTTRQQLCQTLNNSSTCSCTRNNMAGCFQQAARSNLAWTRFCPQSFSIS